jgi:hypothetical protein
MRRLYIFFSFCRIPWRFIITSLGLERLIKSTPNLETRISSLSRVQTKQNGDVALELRKKEKEIVS